MTLIGPLGDEVTGAITTAVSMALAGALPKPHRDRSPAYSATVNVPHPHTSPSPTHGTTLYDARQIGDFECRVWRRSLEPRSSAGTDSHGELSRLVSTADGK